MLLAQSTVMWSVNVVPVTLFLVLGASWIVSTIASTWAAARETSELNELKRMMIERGMNADEIERVLAAGTGKQAKLPRPSDVPPPAKPQAGPMNWPAHSNR